MGIYNLNLKPLNEITSIGALSILHSETFHPKIAEQFLYEYKKLLGQSTHSEDEQNDMLMQLAKLNDTMTQEFIEYQELSIDELMNHVLYLENNKQENKDSIFIVPVILAPQDTALRSNRVIKN